MKNFTFCTHEISEQNFIESQWGDIVDPREQLFDDDFLGNYYGGPVPSRIGDRLNGDYFPVYRTEQELAQIRGIAHSLVEFEPRATGVLELLGNYIIGTGFNFTARPTSKDTPREIVQGMQKFIDVFLDQNNFQNDLDKEIHARSREDGEVLVALEPSSDGVPSILIFEPDQLTQPRAGRDLEEYIEHKYGVDCSNPTDWKYGVHSLERRTDRAIGYHIVYGGAGDDWDYFPADRMEHFKRNIPRNAKRGVSDFHWVYSEMINEAKLRRNTLTGAQIQAAIAYIRQHAEGVTQGKAAGMVTGSQSGTRLVSNGSGGTRQVSTKRHTPGTVVDIPAGMQYHPGPMGAERNSSLLLPGEYILRCIGSRWQTPEYMISNDASNGNYASTLVAESPFVKAREADQEWYAKRFLSLIWKAAKMCYTGYFGLDKLPWEAVLSLIEIKCDPPEVATRDPLAIAQRQSIELTNGTLSRETAIAESGRDPDEELPKIEAEKSSAVQPSALQGALQGAMESVETSQEAKELFRHISEVIYP